MRRAEIRSYQTFPEVALGGQLGSVDRSKTREGWWDGGNVMILLMVFSGKRNSQGGN